MAQTDSQIVRPGRSTIADGLASQLLAQHVASRIQCWARASPPGARHARWKGRDRGWQATLNAGGWPKREMAVRPGTVGVLICPIGSGEWCARTTLVPHGLGRETDALGVQRGAFRPPEQHLPARAR